MKIKKIITLLISAFATSIVYAAPEDPKEFAPGRILVVPQSGLTDIEFNKILKGHNGKKKKLGQSNVHIVDVPVNSEKDALEKLKKNPHIKFAQLDELIHLNATSNDPYFGSQYHLKKISADLAWDNSEGSGVIIAILDTGVDANHPDLKANVLPGYNSYLRTTDSSDICGHGTAVAGTAAAITNNALGVAGVAGKAKILPIRISIGSGTTPCSAYTSSMADGIIYAADKGAKIVNVSFGNITDSPIVLNAGQYLKNKGGLLFMSAGNDNKSLPSPQTNSAIVVSATTSSDAKAYFSNYGSVVHLAAPGYGVYTTLKGTGYGSKNGTSFSSPVAAGVGALVMAANPKLMPIDVENILFSTATDLGTVGRDVYFGHGRVNAAAAVNKALITTPSVDTIAPTASITSPTASSSVSGVVPVNVNVADNLGVSRVELFVNGSNVAIDSISPFGFSWDSKGVANGMNNLHIIAYDAAGNKTTSATVAVNVANTTTTPIRDTTPPRITIVNPVSGNVSGTVNISVNASDDSGDSGITQTLTIGSRQVASAQGSSLAYNWNTIDFSGTHTITATATDKAGNKNSSSVQVTVNNTGGVSRK